MTKFDLSSNLQLFRNGSNADSGILLYPRNKFKLGVEVFTNKASEQIRISISVLSKDEDEDIVDQLGDVLIVAGGSQFNIPWDRAQRRVWRQELQALNNTAAVLKSELDALREEAAVLRQAWEDEEDPELKQIALQAFRTKQDEVNAKRVEVDAARDDVASKQAEEQFTVETKNIYEEIDPLIDANDVIDVEGLKKVYIRGVDLASFL